LIILQTENKRRKKIKMEMSPKDRLSILAMAIIGMIIFLLIAYDPLNILDTSQKWILGLIVAVANVPLLWYQVKRIKNRTKEIRIFLSIFEAFLRLQKCS